MLVIYLLFVAIAVVYANNSTASTCGGNCPGGKCPACPCGTSTQYESASTWCAKYSWNQANCQCIMNHESSANAHAMNYNTDSSYDVGLWQVNDYNWAACNGGAAPCDPQSNLNCAIKVYQWGGNTWKFWSTCGACNACSSN